MSDLDPTVMKLSANVAAMVESIIDLGVYESAEEVLTAALQDFIAVQKIEPDDDIDLRAKIDVGMADVRAGRLVEFDLEGIIERGKQSLAARSACA